MVKQNSASELVKLTPTRLYRVGFSCFMGIAISVSCFIVQSLLTDFSIVLNSLQRRRKGLKAWNNSKKQILVLWTGIYYIWACFEFRISGSSSRTSENLRDGNSPGIKTGLVSKFLTSRNAKPWVQSEFRLSSRIIWGVSAASSRASHPRQPFGDSR